MTDITALMVLFWCHWLVVGYGLLYVVVSRALLSKTSPILKVLDIVYVVVMIGIPIQWFVLKECIISWREKQILDPSYKRGDDPYSNPSLFLGFQNVTLSNPLLQYSMYALWGFIVINLCYIASTWFPHKMNVISPLIGTAFISFIMIMMYVHHNYHGLAKDAIVA